MCQLDLDITKESIGHVCDKPYHTNKKKVPDGGGVCSFAERCIVD